jgi:predicted RNase H-like HicB family nuclease
LVALGHGSKWIYSLGEAGGGWWIGWVREVPGVNAQERSKEALLVSLKQALREALEFNRAKTNK